jgi:hypothetical protein
VADRDDPHAGHDPVSIARLLDRDLDGEERAVAEARISSCSDCARLHDDLLALAAATRAQPIPARPRAFTLTTADAARLAEQSAGEPGTAAARLGAVMTDPSPSSDHAVHDTMLVASLADHSLGEAERAAAQALVADCSQCADLHADLLALRTATRAMPTPARPSDYQLTTGDAHRLRSSGWRRFVAMLGSSRDALSRPLAVGLTTLGLAGLLVANIPSLTFSGGATSAPMAAASAPAGGAAAGNGNVSTILGASAAAEAAASNAPPPADTAGSPEGSGAPDRAAPVPGAGVMAPLQPAASATTAPQPAAGATTAPDTQGATKGSEYGGSGSSGTSSISGPSGEAGDGSDLLDAQEIGGVSPLVVLSLAFLIAGLGLFVLRWTARRFGGG